MSLLNQQVGLDQQIAKAQQRAQEIDLPSLLAIDPNTPPRDMASDADIADRKQLFLQTNGDNSQTRDAFERLIGGNDLQPVNYLAHGAVAAKPVCRLTLNDSKGRAAGYATGFLIAPTVLLTNNHVFPTKDSAVQSLAEFDFELDLLDQPKTSVFFGLSPDLLFLTSVDLDYSIVAVQPRSVSGVPLANYGYLPLLGSPGKVIEGEWMTIIQHPDAQRKQVCVRENKLLTRTDDVLWYTTDTLGGSSGSPVFNNDWQVVALHHKGIPETGPDGVWQTVDGRDYDPKRDPESAIKWQANEGIRISRLIDVLTQTAPREPLLQPVFTMTPDIARDLMNGFARAYARPVPTDTAMSSQANASPSAPPTRTTPMPLRSINVTLDITDDGRVSVRSAGAAESLTFAESKRATATTTATGGGGTRPPQIDVPVDNDYSAGGKRKGYQADYLGDGIQIPLPELGSLETEVTKLTKPAAGNDHILHYKGYSLVMHAKRKFAIYTAANVDGSGRFHVRRPHDEWRFDPRIPQSAQVGGYYYANNQFDRGHQTRYEDMQYGSSPLDSLERAADTLHYTNSAPQHAKFNQGKQLWQGLEQDVLEQAIEASKFRAIVMTGPVLDDGDPVWDKFKDIQYPVRFWKIAVALTAENQAFAAGFVLDQSEVIAQFGIEVTEAPPFAPFKTYQVAVAEIERLTGLTFKMTGGRSLSEADPLADGPTRRSALSRAGVATTESTAGADAAPYGYVPLYDGSTIVGPKPSTGPGGTTLTRDQNRDAGTPSEYRSSWASAPRRPLPRGLV